MATEVRASVIGWRTISGWPHRLLLLFELT